MGNNKLHGVWDDTTRVWSRLYIAREYVFGTILYTQCSSTDHAHPSPRHCRTKLRQRKSRRQSAKIHPFVRTHIYIFGIVKCTQTAKTTTKFKGGEASCSMNVFLPLTFPVIREWWRCSQIAMQTNMHAASSQPAETIWQMPSLFLWTNHYRVTDWRVMDWRVIDWRYTPIPSSLVDLILITTSPLSSSGSMWSWRYCILWMTVIIIFKLRIWRIQFINEDWMTVIIIFKLRIWRTHSVSIRTVSPYHYYS